MEYEYVHDAVNGSAKARFSIEHEVMGTWLEVEVGNNPEKITQLLTAIDNVESGKDKEVMITGSEYCVVINTNDVEIQTNDSMDGFEELPDQLKEEKIDFDQNCKTSCGIDDFRAMLMSWSKFTN